jgi:ketosteroid isomerase-like protein
VLLLGVIAPPVHAAESLGEVERLTAAGRHDEAVERLDALVEATPEDPAPRFLLGNVLTAAGRYADAIDVYVQLTRDFPGRPEPHNNLAVIFVEQGRLEEARTALLAAARLRPGYARAQDNLGDLYRLMAEAAYARANEIRASTEPAADGRDEPHAGAGLPASDGGAEIAAAPDPADRRQPPPVFALAERRAVLAAVEAWRAAWSARDVGGYLDAYAPDYRPDADTTSEAWRGLRRDRLTRPEWIEVELHAIELAETGPARAVVTFEQAYRASNYSDSVSKRLVLARSAGRWRIVEEASR